MRSVARFLAILFGAILIDCKQPVAANQTEHSQPLLRLESPDAAFRLSAKERLKIRPAFDADALEKLLRMMRPEWRQEVLVAFQYPGASQPVLNLVQLDDPILQSQLEEVWAPHWAHYSASAIRAEQAPFPGKHIAELRASSNR